ncbi:hypothetical protein K2173_010261 [Erythroxylum novogranatense]|uniref:Membrane-associated kinase regulator 2 n=1 Tax=Erythroxylum novogranatense TaxID=1862640 RepID=A0AAV8TDB5_9ROSI|nr:hypothetical protein K2173_010261 [Erythroxylum novogranatense]
MEAFSLLKYWRGGGNSNLNTRAATIVTAVPHNAVETDDDDDDDGPFFDLEFAVPDEDEDGEDKGRKTDSEEENDDDVESSGDDDDKTFNFTLSPASGNDRSDSAQPLSPSDDLFFKGRLVPIEPSSIVFNGSESNAKPQFPVSLLRSATKFRVLMWKLKKSKLNPPTEKPNDQKLEGNACVATSEMKPEDKEEESNDQRKLFTVKFKVEEVPIVSLFTRENSKNKSQKQNTEECIATATAEEKRFSKDVMQKYLKKVKPLYVRVSKRYGEKLGFSGQLSLGSGPKTTQSITTRKPSPTKSIEKSQLGMEDSVETAPASNVKTQKQGNLQAGLRVVCKHLGKSRSASSAVAAATAPLTSKRRDDSLLQQQDGIQSAILHCKRSFNASRESESTLLSRSVSDPSYEKSVEASSKSSL